MQIKAVTYNVLATAYIKLARYPFTPPELLDAKVRLPALIAHIIQFEADLLCLQEVEEAMFRGMHRALLPLGYEGVFTKKGGGKPDGCAIFIQSKLLAWGQLMRLDYDDACGEQPRSGHITQLLLLHLEGRCLGVANTHLKWDPPSTPWDHRYGYRQITELLHVRQHLMPACDGWVICGDFNVTAEDAVIQTLQRSGFQRSHAHTHGVATCNANQRAQMVDYLFHSDTLVSTALELPLVYNDTPLPGPGQPSDHVAVSALLQWKETP